MLGLFQSDLPIGRRLWIMILILVISGALTDGSVSFSENSIIFLVDTLLFFGYLILLTFFITFIPGFIGQILERRKNEIRISQKTQISCFQENQSNSWLKIIVNISFVVAVILAIPDYGSQKMQVGGIVGLCFLLLIEVINFNLFYTNTFEFFVLERHASGKISSKYCSEKNILEFDIIDSDWLIELAHFVDNGWELIGLNESPKHSIATFQRLQRKTKIDKLRSKLHGMRIKQK